jgi:(2Fe-2S) ferredoxin
MRVTQKRSRKATPCLAISTPEQKRYLIYHDVKAEDAPKIVERMLKAYLAHRASPRKSFLAFTRRHEIDALRSLIEGETVG